MENKRTYSLYGLHAGDGKIRYIGITSRNPARRLSSHRCESKSSQLPVHRWMVKHGVDNIVMDVLETFEDHAELLAAEVLYIKNYREEGFDLLNLTDGGEGLLGFVQSDEWRAQHSKRMSGAGNPMYGVTLPRETIEKTRQANLGRKFSDEWKAERSALYSGEGNPNFGKTHSDETKRKIGEATKAKPRRGMHNRWHVNRGVVNPECIFCV